METVSVKVSMHVWHALKVAAARLDVTMLELLARIGRGNLEAVRAFQREYKEVTHGE